jgi:hypothetical protein
MTNKLTEQQIQAQLLAEFDAIDKLGRGLGRVAGSAAKGVGAVAGGVAGLGSAVKKGYQAGKQTVGGGGANVNKGQTKQQPAQQKQPSKTGGVLKNLAKNVGNVALDTAAGSGYDYKQGVNPNPTSGPAAGLKKADAEAQRKAGLEKKLGTTGTQATATNTAKTAVDKSIARNQKKKDKQSAMKQGIDQAQIDGANKGVANIKKQAGQTATKVPGQKAPVAQVDANKDGKDDKTGKPISKTAQNVGAKTGVQTAKIGGQKMDLNDPKMANMRAAIDKALGKGTTASIDKLDPPGKEKLKKALA